MSNKKNSKTTIFPACLPRAFSRGLALVLATLLFTLPVSVSFADDSISAADEEAVHAQAMLVVKELHEKLLHIMQNSEALGYQGRYQEMEGVVISRFDTPLIAKVIMSRYWRKLDDEKKMDFIKLFQRLSVATYASRFDGYDNESFVELSAERLKKGRLLIKTELQRQHDKPVNLDYLMHQKDGQWKIISVIANGVNDLSLKRAEYATVIKDHGFDGLVEEVGRKIKEMENPEKD